MLYDTPGLHLHHRMPHLLSPEENKALHPRRRLRPYFAPSLGQLLEAAGAVPSDTEGQLPSSSAGADVTAGGGAAAEPLGSYWWGGLVRIDVRQGPPSLQLVFYGPPALKVTAAAAAGAAFEAGGAAAEPPAAPGSGPGSASEDSSAGASTEDEAAGAAAAAGPGAAFGAGSAAARGGLRLAKRVSFRLPGGRSERRLQLLGDVAVSGVPGWVAVLAAGPGGQRVELEVWAPVGVEAFSRPPLPVPLSRPA